MMQKHDTASDPKQDMKRVFATRLTSARMRKGWNQSELARQAAIHTEDKNFGRALVSMYERARMFPNPFHLIALAKALGVEPNDLAPSSMPKLEDSAPQLLTEDKGGGMVLLRVNQVIPWSKALTILELLRSPDGHSKN
jgi:transcriptional regulator with XRE-family HTH domain